MSEQLEQLNECLHRFKAERVSDITDKYAYYPDFAASRLGSGSYGEAFRVRSVANAAEPHRVVKVIPKARVSRTSLQVQHLCGELAVTTIFDHKNLNKRTALYHNETHLFIVLELCAGTQPSLRTRLAHVFALNHPRRIADIDAIVAKAEAEGAAAGVSADAWFEQQGTMRVILAECAAKREIPVSCDLFNFIVAMKRVPEGLSRIIIRQALVALQHLHDSNVVHRDVKTENLVLGITRNAELIYEPKPGADGEAAEQAIVGVRISETVTCKLIDFGLVKYMQLSNLPPIMSPGNFKAPGNSGLSPATAGAPGATGLGSIDGRNTNFDTSDDDDDDNNNKPAAAAVKSAFPVAVTPCGTELYCSLEVIDGILKSGGGRVKWQSDSQALPKLDVYGAGTMLFCMANGRPPFRPPRDSYRPVSREERMRQIHKQIAAGPVFASNVPEAVQALVQQLMQNDPAARPSAGAALRHEFLTNPAAQSNTYTYEVRCEGAIRVLADDVVVGGEKPASSSNDGQTASPAQSSAEGAGASSGGSGTGGEQTATATADEDDDGGVFEGDVMAVLRGREDNGDDANKDDDA
jgi:serine/threonine protein kinase